MCIVGNCSITCMPIHAHTYVCMWIYWFCGALGKTSQRRHVHAVCVYIYFISIYLHSFAFICLCSYLTVLRVFLRIRFSVVRN